MARFSPVRRRFRKLKIAIAFLSATSVVGFAPAGAEVLVEGSVGSARVQASKVPVAEVLTALGTAFGVRYRAVVALDRPVTGSFSGPLQRIVADLLDGYDYVLKTSPDTIEIVVVGKQGSNASFSAIPAAPGWRSSIGNARAIRDSAPSR